MTVHDGENMKSQSTENDEVASEGRRNINGLRKTKHEKDSVWKLKPADKGGKTFKRDRREPPTTKESKMENRARCPTHV